MSSHDTWDRAPASDRRSKSELAASPMSKSPLLSMLRKVQQVTSAEDTARDVGKAVLLPSVYGDEMARKTFKEPRRSGIKTFLIKRC